MSGSTNRMLMWLLMAGILLVASMAPSFAQAPATPDVPLNLQNEGNNADFWRQVRRGDEGYAPTPNPFADQLIQSEGENWREVRNGPYKLYGGWLILGFIGLIALFFALRGRVRIESGKSGVEIRRFGFIGRFAHWLTATCFIILALTGLSLMFGRQLLIPLLGKEAFTPIAMYGKYLHNYLALGFMVGITMMFFLWVLHNLPSRYDVIWLLRGGGMLFGGHPPARKFNAGQKIVFWAVILLGLSLSLSGIQLLFPYEFPFFESTFSTLNGWFDLGLPTGLSPLAEQQLATLWHGVIGILLITIIIGHIYIGTLGMQGAFQAMGSGKVDLNWAREHHRIWVEELERKQVKPAE